jgi:hypothetical protein
LKDSTGIDLDSFFLNFKEIVGDQKMYFKKEKGEHEHLEEEENQDETTGLIEKLNAMEINPSGKDKPQTQPEK